MTPNRRDRGFTLIELMVVVAILGILAAIAYPSYQSHILKGHRASAQAFLMDAAQRQAQYFLDNRAYASSLSELFGTASEALAIPGEVSPYYTVTVDPDGTTAGPPPTFLLKAVPKGAQATGAEQTLSIDQSGAKQPSALW